MSESRILVIDADATRAERLAGLLEFMDLTPRWVASAGDVDVRRQRPHDWLAIVVGTLDDGKAADALLPATEPALRTSRTVAVSATERSLRFSRSSRRFDTMCAASQTRCSRASGPARRSLAD